MKTVTLGLMSMVLCFLASCAGGIAEEEGAIMQLNSCMAAAMESREEPSLSTAGSAIGSQTEAPSCAVETAAVSCDDIEGQACTGRAVMCYDYQYGEWFRCRCLEGIWSCYV
jgi:hypothetical protein